MAIAPTDGEVAIGPRDSRAQHEQHVRCDDRGKAEHQPCAPDGRNESQGRRNGYRGADADRDLGDVEEGAPRCQVDQSEGGEPQSDRCGHRCSSYDAEDEQRDGDRRQARERARFRRPHPDSCPE